MGVSMRVFVERRKKGADTWEFDLESGGPLSADFFNVPRGIIIPRGVELYYMLGYPDEPCDRPRDNPSHVPVFGLSKEVTAYFWHVSDADSFWAVKTLREVELVRRCFAIACGVHPRDVGKREEEGTVSVEMPYQRMKAIESEGDEVRLVVNVS